jgi:AraC-like DNA-binding protein
MMARVKIAMASAMTRAAPLIGVQAIHPLLFRLRTLGVALEPFLAPFELTVAHLIDPDGRIPLRLLDPLWQRASEAAGDRDFGLHAAEIVESGSFGILSYLGVSSLTWRDGLNRVQKYFRVFSDASEYQLELEDGVARAIAFHGVAPAGPVRHRVEFTVAVLHCYARRCIDGEWHIDDVFFEHTEPRQLDEHRRLFGRVPTFSAPRSGFSFSAALLERPLKDGDAGLCRILERQADQILADASPALTASAMLRASLLRAGFSGETSLTAAARRLGMSARTLQRRLHDEGTTYARVADEVRHALAVELLSRRDVAIAEVAFALGFSEPAALHHAFKRWTGGTPAEFRRASRGD